MQVNFTKKEFTAKNYNSSSYRGVIASAWWCCSVVFAIFGWLWRVKVEERGQEKRERIGIEETEENRVE